MGKIRFYITVFIVKMIIKFMKLLGYNATDTPGAIALKLCPDILGRLTPPKHVIGITGTNGKTSTNNITSSVLKNTGYIVIDNSFGGNIASGLVSILLTHSDFKGVCHQEYACLEIDERSAVRVYPYLQPEFILVTNLQRDSMMRNANVEFIFDILNKNLPKSTKLVLNGDDLISSRLGKDNQKVYFKVNPLENEVTRDNIVKDITVCPYCGADIKWDFVRYHTIGQGHCSNCDFGSPEAICEAMGVKDGKLLIKYNGKEESYPLVGYRTSDIYNETACITLLKQVGIPDEKIYEGLSKTELPKSRYVESTINGKRIISILSKGMNPIACSNSCDVVNKEPGRKAVIMYLDDGHEAAHSSENIAWIYDTDFEFLNDDSISQIIVGGKRSSDYNVRLQLAGIDGKKIIHKFVPTDTAYELDVNAADIIYILFDMYDIPSYEKILETVKKKCESEVR